MVMLFHNLKWNNWKYWTWPHAWEQQLKDQTNNRGAFWILCTTKRIQDVTGIGSIVSVCMYGHTSRKHGMIWATTNRLRRSSKIRRWCRFLMIPAHPKRNLSRFCTYCPSGRSSDFFSGLDIHSSYRVLRVLYTHGIRNLKILHRAMSCRQYCLTFGSVDLEELE